MPVASQAEAYAHAHYPKREKGKPLFDWITRKLGGGGRRATVVDGETTREYSVRSVERKRRERNNPYQNVPLPRRASTVVSSFVSRSDSELSRPTDDDASIRPIPPSTTNSPAPSTMQARSASLLSPKPTKRQSTSSESCDQSESTKPTTVSFDSGPPLGHLAPVSPATRLLHHNPNPLSPPDANASTITLASSQLPARRLERAGMVTSPSVTWAPDTNDRISDHYAPSGLSMKPKIADVEASVRAVRRRGSGESDGSKWSWKTSDVARAREAGNGMMV